jgi:enoyl-CoA hydratase/carnithine racemase
VNGSLEGRDDILLEMQHALDALEANSEIRALVIAGSGRAFSSGFDLSPREQPFTTVQDWREHARLGNDTFLKIWRSRLPVIAAVNGLCLGGGCELSQRRRVSRLRSSGVTRSSWRAET